MKCYAKLNEHLYLFLYFFFFSFVEDILHKINTCMFDANILTTIDI